MRGDTLETAREGQPMLIDISARNTQDFGQSSLLVVEIRDQNDTRAYVAWQNRYMDALSDYRMTASWIPTEEGTYTVRIFAITSLERPSSLSLIREVEFTIR